MMKYDIVIGIETHVQLKTKSKMFCRCSADFWEAEPNTNVCPVCLGLPGALPVINKSALEKAMLMGMALGSTIATYAQFDRKNYFYPDLAKGYQITQFDHPLNVGGSLEVNGDTIGIVRAHLEEDTGKSNHGVDGSLINFNMAGVPLLEIVSEPQIRSAEQAKAFVQKIRQIAQYIGVNSGHMERGMMRADINISLQEPGKWQYGNGEFDLAEGYSLNNRVEVKNLNSFRSIERAIAYEVKRQAELLDKGEAVEQETRGWDESAGVTITQRSKEEAHDYRYFPEPDLPPLTVNDEWKAEIKSQLPELPGAKLQRLMADYNLSEHNAALVAEDRQFAEWFERSVMLYQQQSNSLSGAAKKISNWLLGEVSRLQNDYQIAVYSSKLTADDLVAVIQMVDSGKLSGANAKEVVEQLFVHGGKAEAIVKERKLEQVSAGDDLTPIVQKVIECNPDAVAKIKAGKSSTVQFLVGQVMRETRGRANPGVVSELLIQLLNK